MNFPDDRKKACAPYVSAHTDCLTSREEHQVQPMLVDDIEEDIELSKRHYPLDALLTDIVGRGHAPSTARISNPLSPREYSVLKLICHGLSNKRIARELNIAPETVKSHAKQILLKFQANTRAAAVAHAASLGLIKILQ
jgi:ATP/maltotriose-dependent transcriptional regulator MalT